MSDTPAPRTPDRTAVEQVIAQGRRRLNRGRARQCLVGATLIVGGLAVLAALGFVYAGHGVPLSLYPATLAAIVVAAAASYWPLAYCDEQVARYLDEHFDLKDAVTADRTFQHTGRRDGFYALQHDWTEQHVAQVDLSRIDIRPPARRLAAAAMILLVLVGLGFAPVSPEVLARRQLEAQTAQRSAELKQAIEEQVEELIVEAEAEERELLEPNELRQWVAQLEETRDLQDLLRQYAHLERKLAEASAKLDQRDAERLLNDAAQRLSQSAESAALGEQLARKQYRQASREMDKLRPDPKAALEAQREQLERLKKTAAQLAESARQHGNRRNARGEGQVSQNQGLAQRMRQTMQQLERDVQAQEKQLAACEASQKRTGQRSASQLRQLAQAADATQQSLGRLQQQLRQLDAARSAQARLNQLRQTLSQYQGYAAGQRPSPFDQSGKQAGTGSSRTVNQDPTPNAGHTTALTGIKNQGPSLTTVEEAATGSGARSGAQSRRQVEHQRQFESFVQRPDVPAAVKGGVKTYFETIHPDAEPRP